MKLKTIVRAFLAASLIFGCAASDMGDGCNSISLTYPDDYRAASVNAAMIAWNQVTSGDHEMRRDEGFHGWSIEYIPASSITCNAIEGTCAGYTDSRHNVIQVVDGLSPMDTYRIVLHELGHVLKLKHTCVNPNLPLKQAAPDVPMCTDVSRGAMDGANPAAEITDADIAECKRVGSC